MLLLLIRNHPALELPDTSSASNPVLAEQHYAAGVAYYFDRQYPEAEKQLAEAIKNDNQDARYYYFLGLSRLQQGPADRRPAQRSFLEAAQLERRNRPALAAVNAALERVQGALRQELNQFRP